MSRHEVNLGLRLVSLEEYDYESDKTAKYARSTYHKWADVKFVFGWDQQLLSFYLQVHDALAVDPDANPVIWLGATKDTEMYEVELLVRAAAHHGLHIDHETQVQLYGEKDDGL